MTNLSQRPEWLVEAIGDDGRVHFSVTLNDRSEDAAILRGPMAYRRWLDHVNASAGDPPNKWVVQEQMDKMAAWSWRATKQR